MVTEELPSPRSVFASWHPLVAAAGGTDKPCYPEFVKFMDCVTNSDPGKDCTYKHFELLRCIHVAAGYID